VSRPGNNSARNICPFFSRNDLNLQDSLGDSSPPCNVKFHTRNNRCSTVTHPTYMVPRYRDNFHRSILGNAVTGGEKISLVTEILLLHFPQILDVSSPCRVSEIALILQSAHRSSLIPLFICELTRGIFLRPYLIPRCLHSVLMLQLATKLPTM